jgi:pimeloyl-ACP methyl ester carboxylesterase
MPTTETIALDDCRLTLRRTGIGQPLLWLHGSDGLAEWPAILDRLAEHYEVIAPDLPGFGESTIPSWMDDISDLAYLQLDLLKALQLERVQLLGHSIGAWVALEMAVRQTERLASLALIAPAGIHVKGAPKADIFMIDPDEQARLAYADEAMGQAAGERAGAAKYQEIAIANRVAAARFGWNPRFHNPRLERWLHRIDVPTLILWGAEDRIFAPAHAAAFQCAIPGARVALIERAGHLPHVERLDETHEAIMDFLSATPADR